MSVRARRHYDIEKSIRDKIEVIKLINRLQKHVLNGLEMSQTQIRAAEILLKKAIPDLLSSENKTDVTHHFAEVPQTMSPDEWQRRYVKPSGELNPARKLN